MSETVASYRVSPTREVLAACIGNRCYYDADFRKRFEKAPRNFLEHAVNEKLHQDTEGQAATVSMGDDVNIKILQNTEETWYVPLPSKESRNHEISEEELEKINAGEVFFSVSITGSIVWFNTAGLIALAIVSGVGATLATGGIVAGSVVAANRL